MQSRAPVRDDDVVQARLSLNDLHKTRLWRLFEKAAQRAPAQVAIDHDGPRALERRGLA